MKRTVIRGMGLGAALVLGACTTDPAAGGLSGQGSVPEAVAALAAPGQDLTSARLMEEDGCYWYRHVGPVETTMLPLRTADGSRICAAKRDA